MTGGTSSSGGTAPSFGDCLGHPDWLLCEDFETTDVDTIPDGWTAQGSVSVVHEGAHGLRSLRAFAEDSGPRRITKDLALGPHWGRVFYRVSTPTPETFVHSTLVELTGEGPELGTAWYRVVDTVQNQERFHQFLFNVQPQSSGEFGKGSSYDFQFSDNWQCVEWYVSGIEQAYKFFENGKELTSISIENGSGNYGADSDRTHLPAQFSSISLGWYNYQSAPPGFVAWFDDLALDEERIGCD